MSQDKQVDDHVGELQDALDTTDQLHTDISRLKRLGVLSATEDTESKKHLDEIAETLTEKLPDE